jgi:hypothetical protein
MHMTAGARDTRAALPGVNSGRRRKITGDRVDAAGPGRTGLGGRTGTICLTAARPRGAGSEGGPPWIS